MLISEDENVNPNMVFMEEWEGITDAMAEVLFWHFVPSKLQRTMLWKPEMIFIACQW